MAGKVEKGGWPEQEVTGHLGSAFRWPRVIRSPAVKLWFQCLPQMLDFLQITQHSQPQPGTSSSIKQEACGRPFIFQLQHLQELWHAPTCDSCRWQSHWYCCTYSGRSSPQIPVQTGCGRTRANRLISFWSCSAPPIGFWRMWLRPWSAWVWTGGRVTVCKIWNQSHLLCTQGPRHCWACLDTHLFSKCCHLNFLTLSPWSYLQTSKVVIKSQRSIDTKCCWFKKNDSFWLDWLLIYST